MPSQAFLKKKQPTYHRVFLSNHLISPERGLNSYEQFDSATNLLQVFTDRELADIFTGLLFVVITGRL